MQGKNKQYIRDLEIAIRKRLGSGRSVLVLGPRQTGKTTLASVLLAGRKNVLEIPLQDPGVRREMEMRPESLIGRVRAGKPHPLVFVDEAQKIPALWDAIQLLIDRREAVFLLTGSSARKLKRTHANLLPGRLVRYQLDPLTWGELGMAGESRVKELKTPIHEPTVRYGLKDVMTFGSLPGIVTAPPRERVELLRAYSEIYLEEEIRAEALSRKLGAFSRFLELAAQESGTSPNLAKLSVESGVSQPAVKGFYEVLADTLVIERVEPFLRSARKRILASPRYYFFDTGVRNALCRLPLESSLAEAQKGPLFEHAVMLEIIRRVRQIGKGWRVHYWRTGGGAEVDCVLDTGQEVIPMEIKAMTRIRRSDIRGLISFLDTYPRLARHGWVVTMGGEPERLDDRITAIPWNCL